MLEEPIVILMSVKTNIIYAIKTYFMMADSLESGFNSYYTIIADLFNFCLCKTQSCLEELGVT